MHVLLVWIVYVTAVLYCTQISVAQPDGNGKIVSCTYRDHRLSADSVCVQSDETSSI